MQPGMPPRPSPGPGRRPNGSPPPRAFPPRPRGPVYAEAADDEEDDTKEDDDRDYARDPNVIDASQITGVDRARAAIIPWFTRIVDSVEQEQNPLNVVLAQVTSQSGPQPVTNIAHDLDTPAADTMNELLRLAVEDMCSAGFKGTKITYSVMLRLQNGQTERRNFVLEQPQLKDVLDEPPARQYFANPDGLVGMFMEQNLQLTKFSLQKASEGKEDLQAQNRELREENRALRRGEIARHREIQILLDGSLQRQFMVDEHRAKVDRDAKIGEGFKAFAPQLLALALPPHMVQTIQAVIGMGGSQGSPAPPGVTGTNYSSRSGVTGTNYSSPQGHQAHASDRANAEDAQAAPSEFDIIDEFIHELEGDQMFMMQLFTLMQEKPKCAELLGKLYEAVTMRRQAEAG